MFVNKCLIVSMMLMIVTGPTTPYASVEHGDFKYVGYTGVYNVLDYSAVSFPTGFTASRDHEPHSPEKCLTGLCKDVQKTCAYSPPSTNRAE